MSSNSDRPIQQNDRMLPSQENWVNFSDGTSEYPMAEYRFYSDAYVTGQVTSGLGPYSFHNTIPAQHHGDQLTSPIVLRVVLALSPTGSPDFSQTDETVYHGGSLDDEIAALTSLLIGIRIRSGGECREFRPGDDPLGRPIAIRETLPPILRVRRGNLRLPSVAGQHNMGELKKLTIIPKLDATRYANLVRACKLYQDALWLAESEPNFAWLMLVSALEVAACDFDTSTGNNEERFRRSKPKVVELLEKHGVPDLVTPIADELTHTLGAMTKFVKFSKKFIPSAPDLRPLPWMQVKWTKSGLTPLLCKIYEYRSRALHGGIPFPLPMLEPPRRFDEGPAFPETATWGEAVSAKSGTWLKEDLPMNLHCFHYLVRGILLNWWDHIDSESGS
ncbi:hypothetical protein [Bremerella alba]|uniref:Apea-like HEPN domain-containing protein n=1 Tax=Bremerella alba TaxID=980252 RepID=A0A7V9A864_9BACT|nr:hypothetical protein [Bremerella alba]MBA2116087.1 hypothetical protein [Bremerella alba]